MEYTFRFYGRERNAIGICESHAVTVSADDMDAAFLKLYDTHEHISDCRLIRNQ